MPLYARRMRRRVAIAAAVALVVVAALAGAWVAFGGDDKSGSELHGTIAFAVLAPSQRTGEVGRRARDLLDGANAAADRINANGGLLGRRLVLTVVDDACSVPVAYEAAKGIAVDGSFSGVVGGMCDDAAAREASVIDASGVPFLVTTGNGADLISSPLRSTYLMNATVHQQALSAVYWMNYRHAQRLALLGDRSAESKTLSHDVVGLLDDVPRLVSLQTLPVGQEDMTIAAKAALASHPNFVLWTGSAASGGALAKALHALGYKGTFTATAASESPEFLAAAGPRGAEGAFVMATSAPANTPTAEQWRAAFRKARGRDPGLDALQAYDAVRTLGQAIRQAGSTEGAKVAANLEKLDLGFTTFLGVVRFAPDHTLLYDNRVILVVRDGAFRWKRSLRTDSLQ